MFKMNVQTKFLTWNQDLAKKFGGIVTNEIRSCWNHILKLFDFLPRKFYPDLVEDCPYKTACLVDCCTLPLLFR